MGKTRPWSGWWLLIALLSLPVLYHLYLTAVAIFYVRVMEPNGIEWNEWMELTILPYRYGEAHWPWYKSTADWWFELIGVS